MVQRRLEIYRVAQRAAGVVEPECRYAHTGPRLPVDGRGQRVRNVERAEEPCGLGDDELDERRIQRGPSPRAQGGDGGVGTAERVKQRRGDRDLRDPRRRRDCLTRDSFGAALAVPLLVDVE